MGEQHDPKTLRALLAASFDEMRQQIEALGGTVENCAGDAILAVFGVPRVSEDDAERAVRAAFAMQESLAQALEASLSPPGTRALTASPRRRRITGGRGRA